MSNPAPSSQAIGVSAIAVDAPVVKRLLPNGASFAEVVFTVVPISRVIDVTLPPDFPVGPVEVIVISKA